MSDSDDQLLRPVIEEDLHGLALVRRVASAVGEPRRPMPIARGEEYITEHRLLRWRREGVFVIDTPRTQGAVGFLGGKSIECQHVRIEAQTPFCQVVLTSLEDRPLSRSRRLLLTAVARAENTGQRYSPRRDSLLDEGRPPILMEPVRAKVTLRGIRVTRVEALSHQGRRTGKTVPVRHGQFQVGNEEAFWYEIEARP